MSKVDQCDQVFGKGTDFLMTAGSYKTQVAKKAKDTDGNEVEVMEDVTRYKYGFNLNYPGFITALPEGPARSYAIKGVLRQVSVDAAGSFNKANDYGTVQDADNFAAKYADDAGFIAALTPAKREKAEKEKMDTAETLALKGLSENYGRIKFGQEWAKLEKDQKAEAKTWAIKQRAENTKNWQKLYAWAQKKDQPSLDI